MDSILFFGELVIETSRPRLSKTGSVIDKDQQWR